MVYWSRSFLVLCVLLCSAGLTAQSTASLIVSSDVDRFWKAYDRIVATPDSAAQVALLQEHYLNDATPGLLAFMERKGYTPERYITAIRAYPEFWASVRANTLKGPAYAKDITVAIDQLKSLYPDLRPASIYFTIGALMSGGSTLNGHVLIGAEIAMADEHTASTEFPDRFRSSLAAYFATNPINDLVFLNVHEYVHTQQRGDGGYDLLSQCVYEGVPEFIAELATGKASPTPCIAYGHANDERVRSRFAREMFSPHFDGWLYNNMDNEFGTRDLGYYVGYALCERYYQHAADKSRAIKDLIELDFADPAAIERFVDSTHYFPTDIRALKEAYDRSRPEVVRISGFASGDRQVDPAIKRMSITFSQPMSKDHRGFDFGPLGESHVLRIERVVGFSEDGRTLEVDIALEPGKQLQVLLTENFRTAEGVPLRPYLVDITTGSR